jgi:F0F1-type ATP synthase membrane subunit b/b'
MNPVLWAALGFVAGLVVMWLVMRFLTVKQLQARNDSLASQITNLERERQKGREEASKLESRLEHREREVTELK